MDGTDLRAARQCRIVIRGRLSDRLGFAFPQWSLERRPGQTIMRGLADSAQLDELLDRLRDLGLELVSVDVGRRRDAVAGGGDADLVEKLRAGDETAFTELIRAHHAVLLGVAMTYVSSRAVAEEVVRETWLRVLGGLDGYEGRSSLRTWIFRIAANEARTRAAHERRSVVFSSEPTGDGDSAGPAVDPERFVPADDPVRPGHWARRPLVWDTPDGRLRSGATRDVLRAAIARLPPCQRLVVALRDVEGWSAEETCEALELTAASQRVLLHRARSSLCEALECHLGAVDAAA